MRVKGGTTTKRRHKKVLAQTKGFRMSKRRLIKSAKEALLHAGQYAYIGRKIKKRDMRKLWIMRISEAVKQYDLSYSKFMHVLKQSKIELNHKMLAELVSNHPEAFKKVVEEAKKNRNKMK